MESVFNVKQYKSMATNSRDANHRSNYQFLAKETLEKRVSYHAYGGQKKPASKNTTKAMWTIRVWNSWAAARNNQLEDGASCIPSADQLGDVSEDKLDEFLAYYVHEVHRADGTSYSHDSLRDLTIGLQRYMRDSLGRKDISFNTNREFRRYVCCRMWMVINDMGLLHAGLRTSVHAVIQRSSNNFKK